MSNQDLIGQWKVTHWIAGLNVSNLSQKDVETIQDEILTIGSQVITLHTSVLDTDDISCPIDNADSGWITQDPYYYFNNIDNDYELSSEQVRNMHLKAPFWQLVSNCIQVYTQANPNSIVFMFGSDFFEAVRVSNS